MNENNQEFLNEINNEIGKLMDVDVQASGEPPVNRRGMRAAQQKKFQVSKKALAWIIVLSVVILLVGGGTGSYFILRNIGRRTLEEHIAVDGVGVTGPDGAIIADGGETITWNGKTYAKKASLINILCMGVDNKTTMPTEEDEVVNGSAGQSDTVFLAVLDAETGELTLLNISRDSMTDVDVYNEDGEFVDTRSMQVCLAYAYGDGRESSCLNMVKSVSRLMYGVPIDAYAAVDLPVVSILNDAVGGVEVTVLEDLSDRDPSLTEGSRVLLQGNLAEIYVRSRNKATLESNNQRMARQKQYIVTFFHKVAARVREDLSVVLTLYQAVQAYSRTSFRLPEILYLASLTAEVNFSEKDIITIPGEVTMGEEYAEYYVDDDALFQIILDTYYQEVS